MEKVKRQFFCNNCGASSLKWIGKCPSCNEWNTYMEKVLVKEDKKEEPSIRGEASSPKAVPLVNKIKNPINNDYVLQLDSREISRENLNSILDRLVGNTVKNQSIGVGKGIRIPIGKSSGKTFHFTIGHESDCFNAIIGGQSGKGKTVLLNNIIAKGLEKYNSDELRFAIIDCSGVGFYEFENAPNIHLFCRSSNVETCVEAVKVLEEELNNRENLFREVGVSDIDKYLKKTKKALPRIICLIDEFHVLHTGGHRSDAYFDKVLVDRIIRVGRKFGMHLIGSTQSLGGGVRRSLLDNIPLRIALGMTTSQSNGFLGLKNDAATNLEVGKAVYNSKNGDSAANKFINISFIEEEDIDRIIALSNKDVTLKFNKIKFD